MRILLLGRTGQLGSDLLSLIKNNINSYEVIPVSHQELDLLQINKIYDFLKNQSFQVLINCTAYNQVEAAEFEKIYDAFMINSHAVKIMATVCEDKKAQLIHLSSDYVFDGSKLKPYKESDPTSPLNIYGSSKALGEKFIQVTCPDAFILRVASLFGIAGSSGKGGNFVETMIRIGKEKGELKVIDDITMSPTYTVDLANSIIQLIDKKPKPGIYHAVNSGEATWYQFAKEIIEQTNIKVNVIPIKNSEYVTLAKRPEYSVLDNTKLNLVTGVFDHWKGALNRYLKEKGHL